jgi:hypothetical protein
MTKFDAAAYLAELRDQRDMIAHNISTWTGSPMSYRDMARIVVDADDFRANEPVTEISPIANTFADLEASYITAALVAGDYIGATEKQARYLAKLHWQSGERRKFEGRLLGREARIMIDQALAKLAPIAG